MHKSTNKNSLSGRKDLAPESLYERAFHARGKHGKTTCYWIETEAKRWGIHIHYQLCGHEGGGGGAADRRASNGRVSPQEQNSIPNPQLSFPWMSTMLPDRACFILGERAECNTTRCVSKNVTKKWSKCQSGIQLGGTLGSWEAIPKVLQASRQTEWDVFHMRLRHPQPIWFLRASIFPYQCPWGTRSTESWSAFRQKTRRSW